MKMAEKAERYVHELQQAGYATDPHYADKVMKIFNGKAINDHAAGSLVSKQILASDKS